MAAGTLSLSGVPEGSAVALPGSVAATNLNVSASVDGAMSDVAFHLEYQGTVLQRLTSAPPHAVTLSNLYPGKYFLSAHLVNDPAIAADLSFDVEASLQPPNDLWMQASPIVALSTVHNGTNTHASNEAGEPVHAGNGGGRSLWWKWQASSNGIVTITTLGSSFDTVLGVYAGTNVTSPTSVASNDDAGSTNRSSQVSFSAVAGTTYSIAVDGAVSASGSIANGTVQLRILAAAPPSVDIASPANGTSILVSSARQTINVPVAGAISDAAGISRVEFALDGAGTSILQTVSPPYQLTMTNLMAGDYLLTVTAVNNLGLAASEHVSFSIAPASAEILLVDANSGVMSGFPFAVIGRKGTSYELQASTNVAAWSPLVLWTNFDGALRVLDTNAPQFSARFYRVITP